MLKNLFTNHNLFDKLTHESAIVVVNHRKLARERDYLHKKERLISPIPLDRN
jgi:hypothetical protein